MWVFLLVWAGSIAALCSPGSVCAQSNPPFQNPSLDSDCYFPQIGDPTEMDTIVGSDSNQDLGGSGIKNMGTKPDGSYGNMFIGNLSPTVALAQVETGPNFNLHKLKASAQKLPSTGNNRISIDFCTFGHFRDQAHIDMFNGWDGIYWADDNGNYDSTRFTFLENNLYGDNGDLNFIAPFAGYFTSDTVEDIIDGFATDWRPDYSQDTGYLEIFKGGAPLYQKDTAFEDTSCVLFRNVLHVYLNRNIIKGNFRGTGRDDLLIEGQYGGNGAPGSNYGDFFFFANETPFSLSNLAQAINSDTLMAAWQDSVSNLGSSYSTLAMPIFPKASNDHSCDFLFAAPTPSTGITALYLFKGGPEFGSHRLTLDSAAFVIHAPSTVDDGTPFWGNFTDAGDMTGTGNNVLYTLGSSSDGSVEWDNFFVMGSALDDKIDIYNVSNSGAHGDSLTANNDSLEDFLLSRIGDLTDRGTLWLYYGSKNIPVHLNPQFADVKNIPTQDGVALFSLSPNPITNGWSVATIVWPVAEDAEYEVYDILGSIVQKGTIRMFAGGEQQRISFPNLQDGTYLWVVHGSSVEARAKVVIVR